MSGSLVSPDVRARVRGLATPIAVGLGRLGLTPNALTLIGFGIAIAAAGRAALQDWVVAGLLVLFGAVFDLFDGALARATSTATRLGAFMDSVFDRWGEGLVYAGITVGAFEAAFDAGVLLAPLAAASAFMVSYTRAKSESLGFTEGSGMAAIGIAPREVRIVILTAGLLLAGSSIGWLAAALGLITVLATITTIQRIYHVVRQSQIKESS